MMPQYSLGVDQVAPLIMPVHVLLMGPDSVKYPSHLAVHNVPTGLSTQASQVAFAMSGSVLLHVAGLQAPLAAQCFF